MDNNKAARIRSGMVGLAMVSSILGGVWLTVSNPDFILPEQFRCRTGGNLGVVQGNDSKSLITLRKMGLTSNDTAYRAWASADASDLHKKQAAQFCATGAAPSP